MNTATLRGKKVVVLGGSSGIGLATAQAAAAEGAQVTIVSANRQRIDDALKTFADGATGIAADLGDEQQIKALFEKIGSLDHLVFTAGENLQIGNLADTDVAAAQKFFNIRYWGAFTAVKYASPLLNKGGSIVLTGGTASEHPMKGWSVGASICAAMKGFMRAMAVELAPIRVNMVIPGLVKTNLWNSMAEEERDGLFKSFGEALPVKRIGEAEDIAQTYLYLMKQGYSTGQSVIVDGGGLIM